MGGGTGVPWCFCAPGTVLGTSNAAFAAHNEPLKCPHSLWVPPPTLMLPRGEEGALRKQVGGHVEGHTGWGGVGGWISQTKGEALERHGARGWMLQHQASWAGQTSKWILGLG